MGHPICLNGADPMSWPGTKRQLLHSVSGIIKLVGWPPCASRIQ